MHILIPYTILCFIYCTALRFCIRRRQKYENIYVQKFLELKLIQKNVYIFIQIGQVFQPFSERFKQGNGTETGTKTGTIQN